MKLEDESPLMDGQKLAELLGEQAKLPKGGMIVSDPPSEIEKGLKVRTNRWTDHGIDD